MNAKKVFQWIAPLLALTQWACAKPGGACGPTARITPLALNAYYVDSANGNDGNDGSSPTTAWRSLSPVNARTFASGDTVHFARGSTWNGASLRIKDAGVTLTNYGSGALPLFKNTGALNALDITAGGVTVDGLAFNDTAVFATFGSTEYQKSGAVLLEAGASNATVKNSEFYGVGVGVKSYATHTTLTANYFHDLIIAYRDASQSYGALGVSLNNANATVAYNRFVNCRSTDSPYGADGGAIEIEGTLYNKDNISIHHNASIGSQGFIEVTESASSNVKVSYNLSDDYQQFIAFDTTTKPLNYAVENNTVVRTHTANATNLFAVFYYREVVQQPADAWLSFRNNVFYTPTAKVLKGTYTYTDHNFPHDHNLYYDGSADPLGYALGAGDAVGNPAFVNPGGDYRLTASSPAVDTAVNLGHTSDLDGNPVPMGAGPDKGAYEFSATADPLITNPGFEAATSLASPWYTTANGGSFGVDAGASKAHSGANNAWIATGGTGWNDLAQNVSVTANTKYTLKVWVKNSGNFTNGYFGAKTTSGALLSEVQYGAASNYTQLSVSFDSGSNSNVMVHAGFCGPGMSSWEQIDDWTLTRP